MNFSVLKYLHVHVYNVHVFLLFQIKPTDNLFYIYSPYYVINTILIDFN